MPIAPRTIFHINALSQPSIVAFPMLQFALFSALMLVVLVASSYARYKLNERRFLRRNSAGIEQFQTYGHKVRTQLVEGTLRRVSTIAQWVSALALAGAVLAMVLSKFK